jgi:hypothetical protein
MNLSNVHGLEQQILDCQLAVVRESISHGGEKGVALEGYVRHLLRDQLPQEYGVTSGFIAYPRAAREDDETPLSGQLDVIVYDALRCSPLVRLPTCDIVPLEAVLACIEVKTTVTATGEGDASLHKCLEQAQGIRRQTVRWFWRNTGRNSAVPVGVNCVSPRTYLFALEGPEPATIMRGLATGMRTLGEHAEFSGVFIGTSGFFRSRPKTPGERWTPDMKHVPQAEALSAFKHALLHDLARYPRYAPGVLLGVDAIARLGMSARVGSIIEGTATMLTVLDLDGNEIPVPDKLELTTAYLDQYAPRAVRAMLGSPWVSIPEDASD